MRMTPLDIQSHRFARRFSGLDPDEVESFLRMIAEDYESLLRENETQNERVRRLEAQVEELQTNESLLKDSFIAYLHPRHEEIHAVLLSHNHYDHLEERTAKALGNEPTWYVPSARISPISSSASPWASGGIRWKA